jgi:hypothetical protein
MSIPETAQSNDPGTSARDGYPLDMEEITALAEESH